MQRVRELVRRLAATFRPHHRDGEIEEELRVHLELAAEEARRTGRSPADAAREARRRAGGVGEALEAVRDQRGFTVFRGLGQDLRLAVRSLRAMPVVTAAALASIGLAMGANTALFSILNSLVVQPLPVRGAERLVHATDSVTIDDGSTRIRAWSYPVWRAIRDADLFEMATAWSFVRFDLGVGGETQFVQGMWADGGFFEALGVAPHRGRTFSARDDQPGGGPDGPVAVISYRYWQQAYRGAADVIGRSIRLDGVPFAIVGVTGPNFFGLEVGRSFDVVVPVQTEPLIRGEASVLHSAASNFLSILVRLGPAQPLPAAIAAFRNAQPGIRRASLGPQDLAEADRFLASPFTLLPASTGASSLRRVYERPLLLLVAIVGLVLLVGCVNITNLLLARAIARRYQLAVRLALGATRWRLVRQLFAESALVAGLGAVAGLAIAALASRFLVRQLSTPAVPVFLDLSLNGAVLSFSAALMIVTTLLFGTVPALTSVRTSPLSALQRPRGAASRGRSRYMDGLLVGQVAFSMILVVAAGVFIRSFVTLATRPMGYEPRSTLVVTLASPDRPADAISNALHYERLRESVRALPDVEQAAVSFLTPANGAGWTPAVEISHLASRTYVEANRDVIGNIVSPGWFETFGTPIVSGRDIAAADGPGTARVALVNQAFVDRFLGPAPALGAHLTVFANTPRARQFEIVGVVADAIYSSSPRAPVRPAYFVPMTQFDVFQPVAALSVRAASGPPARLSPSITAAIGAIDPRISLTFRAVDDQIWTALTPDRLMAQLAGFFGMLALLLAGLGLYGVTSYALTCQRGEIGIRLALGATPAEVVRLVLSRTAFLVLAGGITGAGASLWGAQFVGGLVYGSSPRDPLTVSVGLIVLGGIGIAAGWLPARRAARLDPGAVLRAG